MSTPAWDAATETRYEESLRSGVCDACGERPGEIAEDGEWVCAVCSAALEIADVDDGLDAA